MQTIFQLVGLILYIVTAYAIMQIAHKLKVHYGWLAFIPIANIFLMLKMAGLSYWYFLLFIVPIANVILAVVIWMKIAERLGFNKWSGLWTLLPIANIIFVWYLAFAKSPTAPSMS